MYWPLELYNATDSQPDGEHSLPNEEPGTHLPSPSSVDLNHVL